MLLEKARVLQSRGVCRSKIHGFCGADIQQHKLPDSVGGGAASGIFQFQRLVACICRVPGVGTVRRQVRLAKPKVVRPKVVPVEFGVREHLWNHAEGLYW